jgi:hypothetical protein
VLAKQSAVLYDNLKQSSPLSFEYFLYKAGVIPRRWYEWYAKEWRSKTAAIAVAVLFATGIAVGAYLVATPENIASCYVWRLHKDNGTDSDHFRKVKIVGIPRKLVNTVSGTHTALDRANLPAKTADNVLALLPQSRQLAAAKAVDIQGLLGESRHTHNSDIRARIQEVLLYLAKEKGIQVPQNLLDWQSDPKDTATSVD